MTIEPAQNLDPLTLLAWHVAMGADEAIGDDALDRFSQIPTPPQMPAARPAQRPAAPTGPRPVAARPAQAQTGAGAGAAALAAAQCASLSDLQTAMEAFDGGLLKRSAKNTVFADGVAGAPLMVIGEAPGADEDRDGKPFVGEQGLLLDRMLASIGHARDKNAYITNMVPWRPLGNRTPDPDMIALCLPFMRRHIELAEPKILLLLGGVPTKALVGSDDGMARLRGRWRAIEIGTQTFAAMPTYHPSYLLKQPGMKSLAWRDLLAVREKLTSL